MYLRSTLRRRLPRYGQVLVVATAVFVVFAPRLEQWGFVEPLLAAIG